MATVDVGWCIPCCVEPCEFCNSGQIPNVISATIAGISSTGPTRGVSGATGYTCGCPCGDINGSFDLERDLSGQLGTGCVWRFDGTIGASGSPCYGPVAFIVYIRIYSNTIRLGVDANSSGAYLDITVSTPIDCKTDLLALGVQTLNAWYSFAYCCYFGLVPGPNGTTFNITAIT